MFLAALISAPVDIMIMLLVAFLIGFGIAWLLRKHKVSELQNEILELQREIRNLHIANENLDIAKDKLQDQLNQCVESKENLVNIEELQHVSTELKKERERSETARHSLAEIERAHEALKQDLQLKIDQMLPKEEANKFRSEINRLRVFNATLEEELRTLKERYSESQGEEDLETSYQQTDVGQSPGTDFASSLGIKTASVHQKDDLKKISGVGPFIEEKLNRLGIYTFDQIAGITPEQAERINQAIEFFPGRIQRDDWVSQARRLGSNRTIEQ